MVNTGAWLRSPSGICPVKIRHELSLMSPQASRRPCFCTYCGAALACRRHGNDVPERLTCTRCGTVTYNSPSLLVSAYIFAEDRLLLMRRGLAPYEGKWAPPGGFVEAGESLDAAISREVQEEVGLCLPREHY